MNIYKKIYNPALICCRISQTAKLYFQFHHQKKNPTGSFIVEEGLKKESGSARDLEQRSAGVALFPFWKAAFRSDFQIAAALCGSPRKVSRQISLKVPVLLSPSILHK